VLVSQICSACVHAMQPLPYTAKRGRDSATGGEAAAFATPTKKARDCLAADLATPLPRSPPAEARTPDSVAPPPSATSFGRQAVQVDPLIKVRPESCLAIPRAVPILAKALTRSPACVRRSCTESSTSAHFLTGA
jgi:hypothetical protein